MRVPIIAGTFAGLCKALEDLGCSKWSEVKWSRMPMRTRRGIWSAEVVK